MRRESREEREERERGEREESREEERRETGEPSSKAYLQRKNVQKNRLTMPAFHQSFLFERGPRPSLQLANPDPSTLSGSPERFVEPN